MNRSPMALAGKLSAVAGVVMACAMLMPADSVKAATVTRSYAATVYTVSNNDLLQTQVVSTNNQLMINVGENNANSKGTVAHLTDGWATNATAFVGLCIQGGTNTYILNTTVNTMGYNVTAIETYSGWDNTARAEQSYTVSYSTVGDPNTFVTIATVSAGSPANHQERVSITDFLAAGVKAIRFDFGNGTSQQNNGVGYKELDVNGTAVVALLNGPVTVPNYSFEDPATNLGSIYTGVIPGWTKGGIPGYVWYPNVNFTSLGPLAAPAHSNQCAVLEPGTSSPGIGTLTSASSPGGVVPGYLYTLTVALGHRNLPSPPREPDDYLIELLVRGSTVASNSLSNGYANIPAGGWVDLRTSFTATPEQAGGDLTIRLTHSSDDATYNCATIDNIRLTGWIATGSVISIR